MEVGRRDTKLTVKKDPRTLLEQNRKAMIKANEALKAKEIKMPPQQLVKVTQIMKQRHEAKVDADYIIMSEEEGSENDEPKLTKVQKKYIHEKVFGFDREMMQMANEDEEAESDEDD